MKLEVLPGGDVSDAVGIFFGELCHGLELRRIQAAGWDLDALHAGGVPHCVRTFGEIA